MSTKGTGVGVRDNLVIRGAYFSTVGVMGMVRTSMQEAKVKRGGQTSGTFVDSKPLQR